ncbi:MAG TPA: hypothetical protein VHE35_19280 [Kofleriaceae bacterium]|nr:hypothetical protein [Kofleriaceae bacterium]
MLALLPLAQLALSLVTCSDPVPIYRAGVAEGSICAAAAPAAGLTVVDLSRDWTPPVFAAGTPGEAGEAGAAGDAPSYHDVYLALAQDRFADAGADGVTAGGDRALEIFGILPPLDVVAARLADDARHRCHAAIDDRALADQPTDIREESAGSGAAHVRDAAELRKRLDGERARRGLEDLDQLAAIGRAHARQVARLRTAELRLAAIVAAQAHLRCDGLLEEGEPAGQLGWRTAAGLLVFEKRNLLVPRGRLDAPTRELLREDSRQRDYRGALRVLRERVVAATGLIEDGSAGEGSRPVLGLALDPPGFSHVVGHAPLPDAAPDLISLATEAAARALGWTSPQAALRAMRSLPARVAIPLPAPPPYHAPHMELAAEIDRGDVWYDPRPIERKLERRAALILYAIVDGKRVPLVRWPTTIGGWEHEKVGPGVRDRWKESPVGPRVWRQMVIAPTWLPPDTTPDRELVRHLGGDRYVLFRELFGPSYRSAYGLLMLIHEREAVRRSVVTYADQGVRVHGSGTISSIAEGHSHGCHRLLPPLAIRLGDFLLAHRNHVRRGQQATLYVRTVRWHGTFPVKVTTRGYLVELTPPVPVEVLPGRIRSVRKTPPP